MERKILFKAKRLDNSEWVSGYFYKECGNTYIIEDRQKDSMLNRNEAVLVDPSTVCQFTGLKDKDGKDVYEWDVLEHIKNANIKVCVEWNERGYVLKELGEGTLHLCIQSILDDLVVVHSKFDRKEAKE